MVVARYASNMCFLMEAFENHDSTTVACSAWDYRRNTSLHVFSIVIVLRTELRLFYVSRTVVVARCASDTCFRKEAFENQDSTSVAYSTRDYRRNTSFEVFSIVIVLRTELRLFYVSRTVVVARCASNMCIRMEALEYQDPTTVAYSTWDYRRNASIQEFSVVLVLIIEMRLFYLSSTMVAARWASDTCFLQKRSRTRIPPPLLAQHGIINEVPHYRTVVVARCASDTCIRIEAFENQDSTTVAYSTRDYRRNTSFEVFSIVIVLRTELRLFYVSRTVVVARCASDTCFRKEAFENQDSTSVAYSTRDYRRNTSFEVFSIVIVLRIELRLFYLFRTVVVARCASDTCFRKEAFENQDSTTVAYSTWDYRRNASIQEFSVVLVLIIKMRLFYLTSTMVVARCASGTCFLQKRSRTRIPPPLLAKHVLRIELRLLYISRTVVVARCASDTCFRIEAFENQDSTTVAYSTRDYRRNTSFEVFSIVIVLRTELRLFYVSRTVVVARSASNMCFRTEALEYQDPTNVTYSTLDYRRNASIPEFPVLLVLIIKMRLLYLSSIMVVARCASDTCFLQKRTRTRIPPPLPTQHGNIDEMPQYKSFLLY
ncbi:hypothetical protein ANTQUA_LOCUS6943 [Anthophora quadrimaculata]